METYAIIWSKPNGTETEVDQVRMLADVEKVLLQNVKFNGTWITANRKLLDYGLGEIQIREVFPEPVVADTRQIATDRGVIHELLVEYHDEIKSICAQDDYFIGYNCAYSQATNNSNKLFQTRSFTELADLVGKSIAYFCLQYYEKYIENRRSRKIS